MFSKYSFFVKILFKEITEHRDNNTKRKKIIAYNTLDKNNYSENPHVFIIFWESLSYNYIKKNHSHKVSILLFNKLKEQGIFLITSTVIQFKPAEANLQPCSIIPSYRKKIFKNYENINATCLSIY